MLLISHVGPLSSCEIFVSLVASVYFQCSDKMVDKVEESGLKRADVP